VFWGKSCGLPLAFLWPSCGLPVAFLWPSCGLSQSSSQSPTLALLFLGKTQSLVGKKTFFFIYLGKTQSPIGKKPFCLYRGSRYLVFVAYRWLSPSCRKNPISYWEKNLVVFIGVVAIWFSLLIGCCRRYRLLSLSMFLGKTHCFVGKKPFK